VTPKEEGLLVPGSSVSFRTWGGVGDSGETLGFAGPPDLKTPSFLLFSLSVPARDPSLTHCCRLREYSDTAVAHQERLQNRHPGQGHGSFLGNGLLSLCVSDCLHITGVMERHVHPSAPRFPGKEGAWLRQWVDSTLMHVDEPCPPRWLRLHRSALPCLLLLLPG
jgi:hypothetical protein